MNRQVNGIGCGMQGETITLKTPVVSLLFVSLDGQYSRCRWRASSRKTVSLKKKYNNERAATICCIYYWVTFKICHLVIGIKLSVLTWILTQRATVTFLLNFLWCLFLPNWMLKEKYKMKYLYKNNSLKKLQY